jgi:uncharacterized protein YjbI with pentapeptide repeats
MEPHLEPSEVEGEPFEIGRDPRQMAEAELVALGHHKRPLLADLIYADLSDSHLNGADLSNAKLNGPARLDQACGTPAKLPEGLHPPKPCP